MTPKVVMFSMEVGDAPKEHDQGDGWSIINDFMNSLSLSYPHTHFP